MTQSMGLLLARDVGCDPARILNILVPVEHFLNVAWRLPVRVPEVNRENKRAAAGIVVEDHLGWGVRQDSAVPVMLALDAHGRKRRWQGARGHYVFDTNWHVSAIEITHGRGPHISRT